MLYTVGMRYSKAHKDGFLDGLRHAGHLLEDVPNTELHLSSELEKQIVADYNSHNYAEDSSIHRVLKESFLEADEWRVKFESEQKRSEFWYNVCVANRLTIPETVDNSEATA